MARIQWLCLLVVMLETRWCLGQSLSRLKNVTMSSQFTDWVGSRAVDGNYNTKATDCGCCAATSTTRNLVDQWMEIDMGETTEFNRIVVYGRTSEMPLRQNLIGLSIHLDDSQTSIASITDTDQGYVNFYHFDLGQKYSARRIKLILKGTDNVLLLCEVDVFNDLIISNGKDVTAISTYSNWTPSRAVDGDMRTDADVCLCCAATKPDTDPWMNVDLGAVYLITYIQIYGRTDKQDVGRLPSENENWAKNDTRAWPKVTYEDMVDYFINAKAYDGKKMKSFRALYGYNYVQNGWMGDIYHCVVGDLHYLKAAVSPSQPGVGRNDYKSWVCVTKDNEVVTGHCTCPAGNGRSCSHISAIVYAVTLAWKHGIGGMTCTDKQVAWGKGSAKVLNHEKLSEMSFKRPDPAGIPILKERNRQSLDKMPAPVQHLDHEEFVQHVQQSNIKDLWLFKGSMLNRIVSAPGVEMKEQTSVLHGSHEVETCSHIQGPLDCKPCEEIFLKYVAISESVSTELERRTTSQDSDLWSDARKFRITSSRVNALPKTERGDPNKFVNTHIYNRFKGYAATRHRQKSEAIARGWFEDVSGDRLRGWSCGSSTGTLHCG